MNNNPLVSAIIIFLNEEKFLVEAIESVFSQSYNNWELLLVDDGSADGSTEIARKYAEQCPEKVRYLEHADHKNRGMSASRNVGVRHAKGEYIAFLDADDVWLPHKLTRQLVIMDLQPEAVMTYGTPQLWYGWTGKNEDIERDSLQEITVEPNTLVRPLKLLTLFLDRRAITPAPSDALLRRQIVENVGAFEENFPGMYEDQIFFAKVCLQAPVFVTNECWTKHRQHPDSSCSIWKRTGEYYSAGPNVAFLTWIEKYLDIKAVKEPILRRVLRRRLWRYYHPTLFHYARRTQHLLNAAQSLLKRLARRSMSLPFLRSIQLPRVGR